MPIKRIGIVLPDEIVEAIPADETPKQRKLRERRELRLRQHLMEILDNIATAREFVKGMDYVDFLSDQKTMYAVMQCLTIIGSRIRIIDDNSRRKFPEVMWRSIQAASRMMSRHDYGVTERLIWETVRDDLSALKRAAEHMLKAHPGRLKKGIRGDM